jgi:hypothetical protein
MDAEQAYLFDLNGFIVIKNAVAPAEVARLLAAANVHKRHGTAPRPRDRAPAKGYQNDQDALHWDQSYRALIAHPRISPMIEQLCGPRFRLDHIDVTARQMGDHSFAGTSMLHGGDNPGGGNGFFNFRNGPQRSAPGATVVHLHPRHAAVRGVPMGGRSVAAENRAAAPPPRAGHFQNGLVGVAYELEDTHCNGGGFCCIPGASSLNHHTQHSILRE